jgi:dimeric dUTPase (all-alpha-NTP-PPase superfamily)
MKMNLKEMYKHQAALSSEIVLNHPANGEDRSNKKFLAMLTEIAECANEDREFKFWSNDQKQRPSLLEEYVDIIHWALDHGIDKGFYIEENYTLIVENEDKTDQFLGVFKMAFDYFLNPDIQTYSNFFAAVLGLGTLLGFTQDQIEAAYFSKNEENKKRQETGY